jgi:hypothetical protein
MFLSGAAQAQSVDLDQRWQDIQDDGTWDQVLDRLEREGPQAIVNGTDVVAGDWTDTAGIVYRNMSVDCTGTLIMPDLVLTAGHCMNGVLGAVIGSSHLDQDGEWIRAIATARHPNHMMTYDVGLILLEREATHAPRDIAMDCILDDHLIDGAELAIVGYGATDRQGFRYTRALQEAVFYVKDADCSEGGQSCNRQARPAGEMVGEHPDGRTDACYGDSGGPAYLTTPDGDYLAGVTSRGTGWNCGSGTVFTRADAVVPWIENLSGRTLNRPTCDQSPPPPPADVSPPAHAASADTSDQATAGSCSTSPVSAGWLAALGVLFLRRRD